VQVSDAQLGCRTRCIACGTSFLAQAGQASVPSPLAEGRYPLQPLDEELSPPKPPTPERGLPRHRIPLCPGCHRPVGWQALACPYCGHLFDPLDAERQMEGKARKDGEAHRGGLIDTLGSVSLAVGAMSFCLVGLGPAVALGTGVPAVAMANRDLDRMRTGMVDPAGRLATEHGRNKAVVGVVLALLTGLFWLLVFLNKLGW
jgi:hypothetical protein